MFKEVMKDLWLARISSEAVNQRRDNIITKGKNDKTIK
jgi:hypothetical protein